jgi:hypothetical protein
MYLNLAWEHTGNPCKSSGTRRVPSDIDIPILDSHFDVASDTCILWWTTLVSITVQCFIFSYERVYALTTSRCSDITRVLGAKLKVNGQERAVKGCIMMYCVSIVRTPSGNWGASFGAMPPSTPHAIVRSRNDAMRCMLVTKGNRV